MSAETAPSHLEAGPPPPSEVTHPGLILCVNWLYSKLASADPRLAYEGVESGGQLAVTDPGVYVSHPIDPAKREALQRVYTDVQVDLGRVSRISLSLSEQVMLETEHDVRWRNLALHGLATAHQEQRGGALTPWEEAVRERIAHDVKWRARLLAGLSDKQPINATRLSLQNRLLNEARGYGQHPFRQVIDYEDFLCQLQQVPAAFELIKERLIAGIAVRDTMPLIVAEEIEYQLSSLLHKSQPSAAIADNFYPPGLELLHGKRDLGERYIETVRNDVLPAYYELHDFFSEGYLPHCDPSPTSNPFHGARLELLAQYHTDDESMTPARVGEMGSQWKARAEADLYDVREEFADVLKGKDLAPFIEKLRQGSIGRTPTLQEIRDEYARIQAIHQEILAPKYPAWANDLLQEFPMEFVVDDSTLSRTAFLYYQRPTQSNNWAARFFDPVPNVAAYNWSLMPKREKHEGPRGHHLQFITQIREMGLTVYLRAIAMHPYAIESYATYAELLGDLDRWQRGAAAFNARQEAVVTEADYKWNALGEPANHLSKTQQIRIAQDPMNYVVYSRGREKLWGIRTRAEQVLGSRFSEPEFHGLMVREGPLLPDQLEERVKSWVAAKQIGRVIPFAGPQRNQWGQLTPSHTPGLLQPYRPGLA